MQQSKSLKSSASAPASPNGRKPSLKDEAAAPKLSVDTSKNTKPIQHLVKVFKSPANLILSKPSSIAYFIDLLSPVLSPQKTAHSPLVFNETIQDQYSPRMCASFDGKDRLQSPTKQDFRSSSPTKLANAQNYRPTSPMKQATAQPPSPTKASFGHHVPVKQQQDKPPLSQNKTKKPLFFPKIALHSLRPSPIEISINSYKRVERARRKRDAFLNQRSTKLEQHYEEVRLRILIQKSRDRLQRMRTQAKMDYQLSAAALKRHMIIRKNQERFAARVERVHSIALMQKMKKFLELRHALSDGFLDIIKHDQMHGTQYADDIVQNSEFLAGLNVNTTFDEADEYGDQATVFSPNNDSTYSDSTTYSDFAFDAEAYTSSILESHSSPYKGSFLYKTKETVKEKLAHSIKRSKSLPLNLLEETDDYTFLELAELMPPVNRFTLRELELDEILSNAQLRHDLVFDSDLKFKPNVEQDPEIVEKLADYWDELLLEVSLGQLYRIPLLVAEIRAILIELLPNGQDIKDELFQNIDAVLVAQQIEHGSMDPNPLIKYLAKLIKTNCAPIRDVLVDRMVSECASGDIIETLKLLFEILEFMKLVYSKVKCRITPIIKYHDWCHTFLNILPILKNDGLRFSLIRVLFLCK